MRRSSSLVMSCTLVAALALVAGNAGAKKDQPQPQAPLFDWPVLENHPPAG